MYVNLAYQSSSVASFSLKALHLSHCSEWWFLFWWWWWWWWHWDLCKKYSSNFYYLKALRMKNIVSICSPSALRAMISYVIPLCWARTYRILTTTAFGIWFYLFFIPKIPFIQLPLCTLHSPPQLLLPVEGGAHVNSYHEKRALIRTDRGSFW